MRLGGWDIPNSRPTAPPSPLTTSTPAGLGKWAPPISKWAKPEPQKPRGPTENQNRPVLQSQKPRTSLPPNRGFGLKPSTTLIPPRGAPAPGKWSRPPEFTPQKTILAEPILNEPTSRSAHVLRVDERSRTDLQRERKPNIGESSRSLIQPRGGEFAARQNRRWEGNGKHKARGSLLSRRGDDIIPHQLRVHEAKATSKPKIQKAKKTLRINPDINIPSTVSVGNFARLLNVSLGKVLGFSDHGYR